MTATRVAAVPRHRAEHLVFRPENGLENGLDRTSQPARFRPDLRVVRSSTTTSVVLPPATPSAVMPSATVHPAPEPPAPAPLTPARPSPARPSPARPSPARPSLAPARSRVSASAAASPLRLTRRGRVVVAVMVALLVAGLSLAVASAAQASGHSAAQRGTGSNLIQVVVRPGQSLWSVAETTDPNSDPRQLIQQITQLNALTHSTLMAGQRLWVPRS